MAVDPLETPASPAHLAWLVSEGRWAYPAWLRYLNDYLTAFLMDPRERFVAIEAPVRHGKSLFCSIHMPAWFVGMFPDRQVLLTTYSDTLSRNFGEQARTIMENYGQDLFGLSVQRDHRAAGDWKIDGHAGGMRSVAKRGTIIGTGGDLLIIDDPLKDVFDALNPREREDLYLWYSGTVRHRLEPGGKVILVMSRWHEDDLTARLVNSLNPEGDKWERIHLPAIAEPAPWEIAEVEAETGQGSFDVEAWRDPIGRSVGEALWPERWPEEKLNRTRIAVGPSIWAAQFQQMPTTPGDEMFPVHKWEPEDEPPRKLDRVRRWDLGGAHGDFTAGALLGRDSHGYTHVLDVRRLRGTDHEKEKFVRSTAEEDAARWGAVHHIIEQEPGSSGVTVAEHYVREVLAGFSAAKRTTSRNKVLNAQGLAAQQQAGNAFIVRAQRPDGTGYMPASWWTMFAEEARDFPRGSHDDMIDAASQAYNDLVERARKRAKSKAAVASSAGRVVRD